MVGKVDVGKRYALSVVDKANNLIDRKLQYFIFNFHPHPLLLSLI